MACSTCGRILRKDARSRDHEERERHAGGLSRDGRGAGLQGQQSEEEAENGEDQEANPDSLEHTDNWVKGQHKEEAASGKAYVHHLASEQFKERSEAEPIEDFSPEMTHGRRTSDCRRALSDLPIVISPASISETWAIGLFTERC